MQKKIIAVAGATGAQGGGLVRAILADPKSQFTPRAITRDPNSEAALQLARAGAQVVAGDLDDPESIKRAFEGADAAYCVTFYWAHVSPEKELEHAHTLALCAKEAQVRHVIWSTLEDTRTTVPLESDLLPTLLGKYKVPHFDAKGEANHYFSDYSIPTTFLVTSFYWDNFIYFGLGPKPDDDGTLALTLPMGDKKLPGIAAEDIGKCAYGIFKRGGEFIGKTVGIAGEKLTGAQMAEKMSRALGRPVRYHDIDPAIFRGLGFPGAEDLGNMFQFKRDFEELYCGARDINLSRALNPELQTFDAWLERNADKLIAPTYSQ